jgi:hypothetical protein
MHLMLGGTMLVMGLVGTLFNTRYMAKITFNFTVSLTLITLGIMMKYHEQEEGLIGIVHDTFTYGMYRILEYSHYVALLQREI